MVDKIQQDFPVTPSPVILKNNGSSGTTLSISPKKVITKFRSLSKIRKLKARTTYKFVFLYHLFLYRYKP